MAEGRKYSDADVRAIIERALKTERGTSGDLAHADLLAVGEQIGISAEAMTRAAAEVEQAQLDRAATQAVSKRRRRWLALHAALFALLNGLLYVVNAATTPGEWWVLFPLFFWGLALMAHAALALGLGVSARALARERRRLERLEAATSASARLRVEPEHAPSVAAAEQNAAEVAASDLREPLDAARTRSS